MLDVEAAGLNKSRTVEPVAPVGTIPGKLPQQSKDGDTYTPGPTGSRPLGLYKDKPASAMVRLSEEKKERALDVQVGGSHYKDFEIQPIEFIMKNKLNFCQGNIIKYVCRYADKNGIEDLKKALHYINLLIQLEYGDEDQGVQAK